MVSGHINLITVNYGMLYYIITEWGSVGRLSSLNLWEKYQTASLLILVGELYIPSGYVKIAMENGPFIVDLPIKHADFP